MSVSLEPIGTLPKIASDAIKNAHGGATMTVKYVSSDAIRRTMLAWGFIEMFARFGYTYALSAASRAVRNQLLLGTSSLGKDYVVGYKPLGVPFPRPEPVLNMLSIGIQDDGSHHFLIAAVGVSYGSLATVLMPLAGDPAGERIRATNAYRDENGQFKGPMVPLPFGDLFESFKGRSFLGERCRYALQEEHGLLELVSATPLEVDETLADARVPAPPQTRRRRPDIDADWPSRLPNLIASASAGEWVAAAKRDLLARLEEAGLKNEAARISGLPIDSAPAVFLEQATEILPGYLAEHLGDSYALLFEKRDVVDVSPEEVMDRVRELIARHPQGPVMGSRYSEWTADPESRVASHAMIFVAKTHELIVGPFYTARTLALAVQEELPTWRVTP